jgi:flotillin
MQAEAIKNLKIDKITVWDSGSSDKNGASTANFLSGIIKSLPPLHDIAEMAGLELPKFLGETKPAANTGNGSVEQKSGLTKSSADPEVPDSMKEETGGKNSRDR